jgi:hypothetical protein
MRSLSTSAFGQPSETKEMRGAVRRSIWEVSVISVDCHGRAAEARNSRKRGEFPGDWRVVIAANGHGALRR